MVAWARKYGIQSTIHTGGPSIPGSGLIDKDVVLEADADIIGHINGGHTSLPEAHVCELCEKIVARHRDRAQRQREDRHRRRQRGAGTEVPAPRDPRHRRAGRLGRAAAGHPAHDRDAVERSPNIPAELVFCFATGNTARIRKLNCGLIEVGRAADFVFMDRAQHSPAAGLLESVQLGDIPGVGMVMIDGIVRCGRSRNTPPATEVPVAISGTR